MRRRIEQRQAREALGEFCRKKRFEIRPVFHGFTKRSHKCRRNTNHCIEGSALSPRREEVKEIAEHWPGIHFPRTTSAYHERIQDLAGKAYIAKQERRDENGKKEKPPGLESYDWDLTYRGAVAAVTLPSVMNDLSDFMRWKREGNLLRLPGLETISMFIQKEVASDYWKHFVFEVTRQTLLSCDIFDTSEDELYRIWDEAHTNQLTRIFAIIRSKDRNEFMELKRLGWNEGSARKYERALANNTEFRKKLQENARAARLSAQYFQEAMKNFESSLSK